eukprot:CAMPEP_0194570378 /NCGR_PEP_ID=MMETSP0292-20121207/7706_1 /TAXON_ID=39354 /ORGANISM="Heterosigma akashiwo, Strain CCMP2393" /LENGTH=104 /DNA_ID=CAMNT_0039420793 /DNA_START=247 /DNA_END=557 /DNA_ORIENTATION=-
MDLETSSRTSLNLADGIRSKSKLCLWSPLLFRISAPSPAPGLGSGRRSAPSPGPRIGATRALGRDADDARAEPGAPLLPVSDCVEGPGQGASAAPGPAAGPAAA